jgi:hypothetical protein
MASPTLMTGGDYLGIPKALLNLVDWPIQQIHKHYRPQDITPEQMDRFHGGPMGGWQATVFSGPESYTDKDSATARRFRERLGQVMENSAVARVNDSWFTPQQIVQAMALNEGRDPATDYQAVVGILGGLPGDYTPEQQELASAVVSLSAESLPAGYGDTRNNIPYPAMQQSDYDSLVSRFGENTARYMLTDEGRDLHDKIAAVNLMRTLQSGDMAPTYAQPSSAAISGATQFLRNVLTPQAVFGDWTGQDEVESLGGRGFAGQADPAGRIREAMYWDDRWNQEKQQAQQEGRPAAHKHPLSGSMFPQYTATSLDGAGRNMLGGEGYYSALNRPVRTLLQMPFETTGQERSDYNELLNKGNRVTPVIPDDARPENWQQATNLALEHGMQNEGWLAAQYPRLMNAIGGKPEYLSPAADLGANLPRFTFEDLPTAAFTALAGSPVLAGLIKDGPKSLLKTVPQFAKYTARNIKEEAPFELATEAGLNPDDFGSLFTPRADNSWMGEGVQASDPNYEQKYNQAYAKRAGEREEMGNLMRGGITRPFASASWEEPNNAGKVLGQLLATPPSQQEQEYEDWRQSQPNKPPQPPKASIIGPDRPMIQARW